MRGVTCYACEILIKQKIKPMKAIFTFLSMWFMLSYVGINAQNDPTIDQLGTVKIMEDDPVQSIKLTGMTDGDDGTQTLSLTAVSDRPGFFSTLEFNYSDTDTSVVFQSAADSCGIANITITVTDNENTPKFTTMTFAVEVECVNDLPTIDQHGDVVVNEDPPNGVVLVQLTGISAGPPNEPQGLVFSLYPVDQEMIDSMKMDYTTGDDEGTLNIFIARDTSGTSNITIYPIDDGGNLFNGTAMTFNLTVNSVNDAPALDAIGDVTTDNDGMEHIIDLTGISEGAPNETDQVLTFAISSDNSALFSDLLVKYVEGESTGTVKFTPAPGASGEANVTVTVTDDGGTDNGGTDETRQVFKITITDTPTAVSSLNKDKLIVYPNPVTDMLKVNLSEAAMSGVTYEIYSIGGVEVMSGNISGNVISIPVSRLNSGLYQIKVRSGDNIHTGRFVIK